MSAPTEVLSSSDASSGVELRDNLGSVETLPAERLYLNIGAAAASFLVEIRQTDANGQFIDDGKIAVDALLAQGISDIESFANAGYSQGQSASEMLEAAVGEVTPYASDRARLVAEAGETMFNFAFFDLRPHQEVVIEIGEHKIRARLTCDGRYDREQYLYDMGTIAAGYDETGDVVMLRDMADIIALNTLRNGFPFNGLPVKSSRTKVESANGEGLETPDALLDEPNYYASRSQNPTFFDIVRRLGKHMGDEVYTHAAYVHTMEQIWKHFNPKQEDLAMQSGDAFHAYRRGGISPEGLPFSVFGDDRNNGRALGDYIGRDESFAEDGRTAFQAAMRVAPEKRAQQYADTMVHLRAAGECGWDMCLSRYANGGDLSYINTTNIISLDLQLMLIDGGRMLSHSYDLLAKQALEAGDINAAIYYTDQQENIIEHVNQRVQFVETYLYDDATGTYHDGELIEPSGPYDSMREYTGFKRVETISAATGHVLRTLANNGDVGRLMSTIRVAQRDLFGLGGVAATNVKSGEQWDGAQGWAYNNLIWIEALEEAAAAIADEHPEEAEELLLAAEERQQATLVGSQSSFNETGMIAETNNTEAPGKKPVRGEYPKDPNDKRSPWNFAMQAELVVFATLHKTRDRFGRLLAASAVKGKDKAALAA